MKDKIVQKFMFSEREEIKLIASFIEKGGIVLAPTDTVWALCCDATNPLAVERIKEIKRKVNNSGLVVVVESIEMLKNYVSVLHPRLETLLTYHKRPMNVIYPEYKNLAPSVAAEDQSIAIRVTINEFLKEIIWECGIPIVASSANFSGMGSPENFSYINPQIISSVDYVVKYRQMDNSKQSGASIVRLSTNTELDFIRQ